MHAIIVVHFAKKGSHVEVLGRRLETLDEFAALVWEHAARYSRYFHVHAYYNVDPTPWWD